MSVRFVSRSVKGIVHEIRLSGLWLLLLLLLYDELLWYFAQSWCELLAMNLKSLRKMCIEVNMAEIILWRTVPKCSICSTTVA